MQWSTQRSAHLDFAPALRKPDLHLPTLSLTKERTGSVGPFDEANMSVEIVFESDPFCTLNPVQVGMHDRRLSSEDLDQVKGRRTDGLLMAETFDIPSHKGRLARSQRARQQNDVARRPFLPDLLRERP